MDNLQQYQNKRQKKDSIRKRAPVHVMFMQKLCADITLLFTYTVQGKCVRRIRLGSAAAIALNTSQLLSNMKTHDRLATDQTHLLREAVAHMVSQLKVVQITFDAEVGF